MYTYTIQAMPGTKAQFEGDTSVQYQVKRKQTLADQKSRTDVIRTGLDYADATAMVKRFNDKERESRSVKNEAALRLTQEA